MFRDQKAAHNSPLGPPPTALLGCLASALGSAHLAPAKISSIHRFILLIYNKALFKHHLHVILDCCPVRSRVCTYIKIELTNILILERKNYDNNIKCTRIKNLTRQLSEYMSGCIFTCMFCIFPGIDGSVNKPGVGQDKTAGEYCHFQHSQIETM